MENYSVLMSVYYKEKPEYLRQAMQSIYEQTVPTNDFVLVCDGPLTIELDDVISEMQKKFGDRLHVLCLEQNKGLGVALNQGLKTCKNELVARMDSDDISRPYRCERQLKLFSTNPDISLSSGVICEFCNSFDKTIGKRKLPIMNEEIITYSRRRNPMNHPCVMFKKSAVDFSGGYNETYHLFEDYYLWIRMLRKGYKAKNIEDVLLDMRVSADLYLRRGGFEYTKNMLRFHKWMKNVGWSTKYDYIFGAIPHAIICILPNIIRKKIYEKLH